MTVYVGEDQANVAVRALGKAAEECTLVRQIPRGIDHSHEFIKTLFVRFAMSAELKKINHFIRKATNDLWQYELNPHLSLLYKNLAAATRSELAALIPVPQIVRRLANEVVDFLQLCAHG